MSRRTMEERFWAKVRRGPADDCWVWTASTDRHGYGHIWSGRGLVQAHRYSALLHFGPFHRDHVVIHTCDNPPCVNPSHLRIGTRSDNQRDMSAKGRSAQAARSHCPAGHPYDDINTYRNGGRRACRVCRRATVARYRSKESVVTVP